MYAAIFTRPDLEELKLVPYKVRRSGLIKVLCSHKTGLYGIYYFNHDEQRWELDYELGGKSVAMNDIKGMNSFYLVKKNVT